MRALVGSEFCSLSAAAGQHAPQIVVRSLCRLSRPRGSVRALLPIQVVNDKGRYYLNEAFVKAQLLPAIILVAATSAFPQAGARPVGAPMHMLQPHRAFSNILPWFFGDYGYDAYAPAPSMMLVQQPPLYVVVPTAPSAPPKAEIHEYSHPSATGGEEAFAIVLKDGSMHSAVAVTVQANGLYYVEPDGAHRLVKLDALDREATARLNRSASCSFNFRQSTRKNHRGTVKATRRIVVMTSSRGDDPTRWVRRKTSDRGISSPPH